MARTLSITYGAKTVGAGTDIEIDGPVIIRRGHTVFEIEFTVVIVDANVANFAAEIASIEAAFSQPTRRARARPPSRRTW